MMLEWGGWRLDGRTLTKPRKVWLAPAESRIMRVLIERAGKPEPCETLAMLAGMRSVNTTRTIMSRLRDAIGENAIKSNRTHGYRLMPAYVGKAPAADPVEDLIGKLESALAAAKTFRRNSNAGLS